MTRKFLPCGIADERLEDRPGRFSLFDGRLLDARETILVEIV